MTVHWTPVHRPLLPARAIWLSRLVLRARIWADFKDSLSCAWARVTKAKGLRKHDAGTARRAGVFSIPGRVFAGYSRNEKIVPKILLPGGPDLYAPPPANNAIGVNQIAPRCPETTGTGSGLPGDEHAATPRQFPRRRAHPAHTRQGGWSLNPPGQWPRQAIGPLTLAPAQPLLPGGYARAAAPFSWAPCPSQAGCAGKSARLTKGNRISVQLNREHLGPIGSSRSVGKAGAEPAVIGAAPQIGMADEMRMDGDIVIGDDCDRSC